ncbi:MAG: DUF192 domain-containing protein [Candidatus Nanohaloarchaea archaeon]|nr:DUF192 domain-containing protein [Candidatus Nanohaloarchaea archaeon]
MKRYFPYVVIVLTFLSAGCTAAEKPYVEVGSKKVEVEVADNSSERLRGLMNRDDLSINTGMLFVYGDEDFRSFWMKNMSFPIDIIYLDSHRTVVDIKHSIPPCSSDPCPSYKSDRPARYVLEVNSGFSSANNVSSGDRVEFYLE